MDRITEFEHNGKKVVKIDLSNLKTNEELLQITTTAKTVTSRYPPLSVYTIVDVTGITFDTRTKEISVDWAEHDKLYVRKCFIIGATGVRKVMVKTIIKLSGWDNLMILPDLSAVNDYLNSEE